ncbi:amino acid ABC transporter permease [Nitriliruptor sp.]|uniref:amino acid ABC transporter permease n=1 Tax=Nitriliruptor sp. TaxID=2448056 RepID=UPI0034A05F06
MYVVFVVALVGVVTAADWERISFYFLNAETARAMFPEVVTIAMRNTVIYTLSAFAFGMAGGLLLALMKLSSIAPYRWVASIYIEIFRGLPALVTIFLVAFAIPIAFTVRWSDLQKITVGLGLVAAAYLAETLRAGIEGVPKGQMEAARSLGMTHTRAMASIIIPQGFRLVIPPLTNEVVLLIKDTSLVFIIGVTLASRELTKFGTDVARTNATGLLVISALYLALTVPLTRVVAGLERRNARAR